MKAPWNFARFLPLAGRLLARGRLPTLLFAVASKGASQGNRLGKLKDDLRLLQALCLAYWRGEYRAISPKALISVVAGLMYFLSPVDAIPDFIPVFGMLDDIAVLAWLMKVLDDELNAFRAWRNRQLPEKLAVVERLPDTPRTTSASGTEKNLIRLRTVHILMPPATLAAVRITLLGKSADSLSVVVLRGSHGYSDNHTRRRARICGSAMGSVSGSTESSRHQ